MDTDSRRVLWASASALPAFAWPLDPPRPESVEEVAAWDAEDSFISRGYFCPEVLWAILAVLAAAGLGWYEIAEGASEDDAWIFLALIVVLLGAACVWIIRARRPLRVGEEAQRIFDTGVLCGVRRCTREWFDSESAVRTSFIVLDHSLSDRRAWRTFRALDAWAEQASASVLETRIVSSEELFGAVRRGGWVMPSGIVGLSDYETLSEPRWVIVTEPGETYPHVTTVPYAETRADIRVRLRRPNARVRRV